LEDETLDIGEPCGKKRRDDCQNQILDYFERATIEREEEAKKDIGTKTKEVGTSSDEDVLGPPTASPRRLAVQRDAIGTAPDDQLVTPEPVLEKTVWSTSKKDASIQTQEDIVQLPKVTVQARDDFILAFENIVPELRIAEDHIFESQNNESQSSSTPSPKSHQLTMSFPGEENGQEPQSYESIFNEWMKFDETPIDEPPRPKSRLERLITACNEAIMPNEPQILKRPLPKTPKKLNNPRYSNGQTVANGFVQSPMEKELSVYMYPINDGDGVRYVQQAPSKPKQIWRAGRGPNADLTTIQQATMSDYTEVANTHRTELMEGETNHANPLDYHYRPMTVNMYTVLPVRSLEHTAVEHPTSPAKFRGIYNGISLLEPRPNRPTELDEELRRFEAICQQDAERFFHNDDEEDEDEDEEEEDFDDFLKRENAEMEKERAERMDRILAETLTVPISEREWWKRQVRRDNSFI
jgi:hypothetical protein